MTQDRSIHHARRSSRWFWLALGALVLAAILFRAPAALFGGQVDPGPPLAGVTTVAVRDNFFAPAAIEIPAGTAVTWTWEGNHDHNVVGDDFASPVQSRGQFAHTFDAPGTYPYVCTLHGGMRGEVIVTEAS